MEDYNNYVNSVNKIFTCLDKMRNSWSNQDNLSYIEKIEEYKDKVIEISNQIKNTAPKMEELSDD